MKLQGQFRIAAPRQEVFERLNDPYFFASCLDGVSNLQEIDADEYSATLETRVAYISLKFEVRVRLIERTADRVRVRVEGEPRGAVGRLTSTATADLRDAEGGATDIFYQMEVALTGRLGSLGEPVIRAKAKEMERGFVRKAAAAFETTTAADGAQAKPPSSDSAPSAKRAMIQSLRLWCASMAERASIRLRASERSQSMPAHGLQAQAASASDSVPRPGPSEPRLTQGGAVRTQLDFTLMRPSSLREAISLLDTDDANVRPFSGGTALMLMMKSGVFSPTSLVDLTAIADDFGPAAEMSGEGLRCSALSSLTEFGRSAAVRSIAPVIETAMPRISNVRVRNAARLGGCLAHGDPHMDLPPILVALRASVEIAGPAGMRVLPVEELYTGYYQTALGRGEIITGVRLPSQSGWRSEYRKVTVRTHDDWPALGVAVSLRFADQVVAEARVVLSAATEKVTRAVDVEEMLTGAAANQTLCTQAGELAADTIATIDDVQGSASYKRELVRVEVRRALQALCDDEVFA